MLIKRLGDSCILHKPARCCFASSAVTWRTRRTYASFLILVIAPLCDNLMTSTKPDFHNMLHCIGPKHGHRKHVHKNFVKLGHAVFEICERTDRQTDTHAYTLITIYRIPRAK